MLTLTKLSGDTVRVPAAAPLMFAAAAQATQPRRRIKVSEWADGNRVLSTKGSNEAGDWVTDRNPPCREPMDAMTAGFVNMRRGG